MFKSLKNDSIPLIGRVDGSVGRNGHLIFIYYSTLPRNGIYPESPGRSIVCLSQSHGCRELFGILYFQYGVPRNGATVYLSTSSSPRRHSELAALRDRHRRQVPRRFCCCGALFSPWEHRGGEIIEVGSGTLVADFNTPSTSSYPNIVCVTCDSAFLYF